MATYIPGITDYIPNIQPFKPDYNFLGNMLQSSQSKYDTANKRLNGIYGTILNSPMTRDSNIKRRDEFIKNVDGELKRISGLDLSLQQNVEQAMTVFKPFYEDKDIQNDMVQTKQFFNGMDKHERLKNCLDPEKCGGQAWEAGAQELQYKREEFRTMSDADAKNFQMPTYNSYYNWEKDAVKLAKDADLKVEQDTVTGQWIVHDSNGKMVQGGLYNLFKSAYGNDPRVTANYNTKAYVDRKNYVSQNAGVHGSEEAAETFYLTDKLNSFNKTFGQVSENINDAVESTTARKKELENKVNTTGITSAEADILNSIDGVNESLNQTQQSLELANHNVNNNIEDKTLATLRRKGDFAAAQLSMNGDLGNMAYTMSLRDAKHTVTANPYGVIAVEQKNRKEMAAVNYQYDLGKLSAKLNADLTIEDVKAGHKSGAIPSSESSVMTPLSDTGYGTSLGTPESGIARNTATAAQMQQESAATNSEFLYNVFNTALVAAQHQNVGATQYLKNTFGDNWNKIKTKEDMINAVKGKGRSLEAAFDNTIKTLDQRKNPTAFVSWADGVMSNGTLIHDIDTKNKSAIAVVQKNLDVTKGVINNIQKQAAAGQTAYTDADLLLSQNGFPLISEEMPKDFAANYYNKHKTDPGFDQDTWYSKAQEIYEPLKDKFVQTFNETPNAMLDQGTGLKGGNTVTAYPVRYDNVNTSAFMDKGTQRAKSILTAVVPKPNAYNVIIGEPTAENINNPDNNDPSYQDQLKRFMNEFQNDMLHQDKKNPNINFSFIESPIAGNDENLSAVTFFPNYDYIKEKIGTKASPGPLYALQGDISKGLTLYYNNKVVRTPTTIATETSDLENVAKYQGLSYTAFPAATEDAKIVSDPNGGYRFNAVLKGYDSDGKPTTHYESKPVQAGSLKEVNAIISSSLDALQKKNTAIERQLAANNKAKSNR